MRTLIFRITAPFFFVALGGLAATGNAADSPDSAVPRVHSICLPISNEELEKIPTARDPWEVLEAVTFALDDRIIISNEHGQRAHYIFDGFEELQATLLEAEAKALCEEVRRDGWEGLSLERVLWTAPSKEESLINADTAGLLRGFVALLLQARSGAELPADVLAEAKEYSRRFGLPSSSDTLPRDE